jgi:hypothetical protein
MPQCVPLLVAAPGAYAQQTLATFDKKTSEVCQTSEVQGGLQGYEPFLSNTGK